MEQESLPPKPSGNTGPGKRLKKPRFPLAAKVAILATAVLCVLAAAYLALCAWAGGRIPDGTVVEVQPGGREVALGGLSPAQAEELLARSVQVDSAYTLSVSCGAHREVIGAQALSPDADGMLRTLAEAEGLITSRPFLTRGFRFFTDRTGSAPVRLRLDTTCHLSREGEALVDQCVDRLAEAVAADPVEPSYTVGEESVEAICGLPGARLDTDAARASVIAALRDGERTLILTPETLQPRILDAADINKAVYVEAVPIQMGADGKVTPAVEGVSIDVEAAQAALDSAAPGQTLTFPLIFTQPDYALADAQGLMYKDLLSECKTYVGGSENRVYNVTLAAAKCNGTVLMPGDVFSYYGAVGECGKAQGFVVDWGFAGGKTVPMEGGGVCQMSSSLYYCAVYANLEIVARVNHAFTVDYLPAGLDATFSAGSLDFRFRNDTEFPIKLVAEVKGRDLTVQFFGTNNDGTYVTTERSQVASVGYTTVYTPDPSIPQGTTKVSITPYTGLTMVVYRCVHAADGTLLSRTYENTSKYAARNRVILYNPADAASLGLEKPPEPTTPPDPETPPEPSTQPDPDTPPEPSTPSDPETPPEPAAEPEPSEPQEVPLD